MYSSNPNAKAPRRQGKKKEENYFLASLWKLDCQCLKFYVLKKFRSGSQFFARELKEDAGQETFYPWRLGVLAFKNFFSNARTGINPRRETGLPGAGLALSG